MPSVPLVLSGPRPRRDPRALLTGLLVARESEIADPVPDHPWIGGTSVRASSVLAEAESAALEPGAGRIVRLDVELPEPAPAARAFRIDVPREHLEDALALTLPAPLIVRCTGGDVVEVAQAVDAAGHHGVVDVTALEDAAPGAAADRAADALSLAAHGAHGVYVIAETADQVIAALAGVVASLRGDDVRDALATPDVPALLRLHPDAVEATRSVLLGVEVPHPAAVIADLARRVPEWADAGTGRGGGALE